MAALCRNLENFLFRHINYVSSQAFDMKIISTVFYSCLELQNGISAKLQVFL